MYTCRNRWNAWPAIRRRANVLSVIGAVVLAVVIVAGKPLLQTTGLWETVAVYGSLVLLAGLIAQPTNWPSRIMEWWPLQWIGKRSCRIYLWHFMIIVVVLTLNLPKRHGDLYRFVIEVVASLVVAGISYRLIERPFLRRKVRFARVHPVARRRSESGHGKDLSQQLSASPGSVSVIHLAVSRRKCIMVSSPLGFLIKRSRGFVKGRVRFSIARCSFENSSPSFRRLRLR